jgi:hypothetical protein
MELISASGVKNNGDWRRCMWCDHHKSSVNKYILLWRLMAFGIPCLSLWIFLRN